MMVVVTAVEILEETEVVVTSKPNAAFNNR